MNLRFTSVAGRILVFGFVAASALAAGGGGAGAAGVGGVQGNGTNGAGGASATGGASVSVGSGGGFSHSSGGGGSFSHGSGNSGFSPPSGGFVSPPSMPARGGSSFSGGRVPSGLVNPPAPVVRAPTVRAPVVQAPVVSAPELPASSRAATQFHPAAAGPVQRAAGISGVPQAGITSAPHPVGPARNTVENFLGIPSNTTTGNAPATGAVHSPSNLAIQRPAGPPPAPAQRSDWAVRSQNRNPQWQQRVESRHLAWNQWQEKNQAQLDTFAQTRDQRWANLQATEQTQTPQSVSNPRSTVSQQHRQATWNFRTDRANEIRGQARDFYDGYFDDHWWGRAPWAYGYGYYGFGHYPRNPWWWWRRASWADVSGFVDGCPTYPAYADYGDNVLYEGDNVYVDGQPMPADQYTGPIEDQTVNAQQPPPPTPPAEGQPAEWMPLGVFALAQEEKGDPILFLQLSVSRAGIISGGYSSTLTHDQRPVIGVLDKASQRVMWRIGANTDTLFETTLANLTQDVSPVAVHFGNTRTQTWLLVRMPEPAPAGGSEDIPGISPTALPSGAPPAAPQ